MGNFFFSGHESFPCKSLWLKKGYDYVKLGKSFNDADAVVSLGVGKNMVSSIRFWLKSFGIIDKNDVVTDIGDYIFADNGGCDPYIEDVSTVWLLHFLLVNNRHATIYYLLFSEFSREQKTFTKLNLLNYIKRHFVDKKFGKIVFNENTISRDIQVFLRNYVSVDDLKFLDDFQTMLSNLNLIRKVGNDEFEFVSKRASQLNPLIFLFAVITISGETEIIDFEKLLSIALIFNIPVNELYEIFDDLHKKIPEISFSNKAGERLFLIQKSFNWRGVLDLYYFSEK